MNKVTNLFSRIEPDDPLFDQFEDASEVELGHTINVYIDAVIYPEEINFALVTREDDLTRCILVTLEGCNCGEIILSDTVAEILGNMPYYRIFRLDLNDMVAHHIARTVEKLPVNYDAILSNRCPTWKISDALATTPTWDTIDDLREWVKHVDSTKVNIDDVNEVIDAIEVRVFISNTDLIGLGTIDSVS